MKSRRRLTTLLFTHLHRWGAWFTALCRMPVYLTRCPIHEPGPAWVLFPYSTSTLHCGLAGLIRFHRPSAPNPMDDLTPLVSLTEEILSHPLAGCLKIPCTIVADFLGGEQPLDKLYAFASKLKQEVPFLAIYHDRKKQKQIEDLSKRISVFIDQESRSLQDRMGHLTAADGEAADQRMEKLRDIAWCLKTELIENIRKIKALAPAGDQPPADRMIKILRNINIVLNSIDRLEVRGRDSAGISLLFIVEPDDYAHLSQTLAQVPLKEELAQRSAQPILGNGSITIHRHNDTGMVGFTLTYKVAAEIGRLGDNVSQLRRAISEDPILQLVCSSPHRFHTVSAHTRWASVGAITIANCHPVDNATVNQDCAEKGMIHACLNGDIDNYLDLKQQWEAAGAPIPEEITTDTKIIPLHIESYLKQGHPVEEAFRLAVNDFEGSHAIAMHTDLAPGKFFLAQKGSGQAIFVGLADDHYLPASEVYGFVEQTPFYLKLDGEKVVEGAQGQTQGQLFILDQDSNDGLEGIKAMYYDGTPIHLEEKDIQQTEITSRDIHRQDFPHYFLKEISEAPLSVHKTLQNRWKVNPNAPDKYIVALDSTAFPESIVQALAGDGIRRVYFIGQGTAGVAAQACADILNYYLNAPLLNISALKASELSGFQLDTGGDQSSMADALVIAISQSGTTTDTNRTVDMVRSLGAHTIAIVNRRDSDITFKTDGVVYTSSGRDIEMSVASTKAFYSQIVAGTLVSLKIAEIMGRRPADFITDELKALQALPDHMRAVLALGDQIRHSAQRLAPGKTYWAAVGSGPNKAAADEIRIKLSELCYKTISSDFVEDKKHIDLSSEPLIVVCAAGASDTVIGDIIKDTAIFSAHKATPVVIVDQGEDRFGPYAEDVFEVPRVHSHLAPILNTLVGHLWGYYAALAINQGSQFLHQFRTEVQQTVDQYAREGMDVYEVMLEKGFREKVVEFYSEFRQRQHSGKLPSTIRHSADLLLLLKYLAGQLPVSDFELDFGRKGTPLNMLDSLFGFLGRSINSMSRPVDAIKHQAKTVTVGTSRISEKLEGVLFSALTSHDINPAQLINRNIIVLKNLQAIVGDIKGSILYRIEGLDVLGEPTDQTTIEVLRKEGALKPLPSRVETDTALKGTKRIVVRQGNVYISKGRKDDRSIVIIPAISTNPTASNRIEYLLLLNVGFKEDVPLAAKIKALGGKYEHIKNIVQENSIPWEDNHLEMVPMEELFGHSAEKIGERLVSQVNSSR